MTGRPRRNGADWSKNHRWSDNSSRPNLFILAGSPGAFSILSGISFLERLLRVVQRIGFREATIVSESVESIRAQSAENLWARTELALKFQEQTRGPAAIGDISRSLNAMSPLDPDRALVQRSIAFARSRLASLFHPDRVRSVLRGSTAFVRVFRTDRLSNQAWNPSGPGDNFLAEDGRRFLNEK